MNFLTIDYLKTGTPKQIKAFEVLTNNQILLKMEVFHPILVGTIPIDIDIENSDLDIICHWENKQDFIDAVLLHFGSEKDFSFREAFIDGEESVVAHFVKDGFEIEFFGQNIPSEHQNGYKHMLVEYEILKAKGEGFRQEIIKLKEEGYKTEPAFCKLLGLAGNPYQELLKYSI
ncbi:DUF4269 domain-containing protein [Flavobacterium sp. PLA-1-15]|uniref:DUF4269 domain-containing protein n=1 Tax=Flavobacterium sp. PLA-1-15 TaxID=3380533 RepID=UPI003B80C1FD